MFKIHILVFLCTIIMYNIYMVIVGLLVKNNLDNGKENFILRSLLPDLSLKIPKLL